MSNFEEKLDNSSLTLEMWLLWILAAGLIALDGFDFFVIGIALPFLKQDFHLTSVETGAVAVAAIAGALLGSLTLGPITDQIGRQKMLVVDLAIFILASAGTALAWNAWSLIIFRFLVGVGIGADYPISVAYITENVPSRLRGRMVIGAFTFQAIGSFLGAMTGIIIITIFEYLYPDSILPAVQYAWRWMLGVGLGFAILVAILRFQFLLESPRYYIAKGDYKAASEAASQLLNETVIITAETEPQLEESDLNYSSLFSAKYWRNTLFASVPWFLQDIATYGIGVFTPSIIAFLAFANETNFLNRELESATSSAVVDLFLILGFILAVLLVDRLGRIPLQIIGFMGMAVGLSILAVAGDPTQTTDPNLLLIFSGFVIFNLLMNMGPNSTTFLISGEVFPTSLRASGAGLAAAIAKSGAVLGTFTLPLLRQSIGVSMLMIMLALCCLLAAVITYFFGIETKGLSLESVNEPHV
ncbi:glucose transport protein [Crocosphaera subtropica ATCC 51142]|uniref:Glucose transport protein n=1 Tax=Crocosphaera subtropica (strain ATCC 51142 / BH68) TaxID=43989 RepID=B1WP11_CROS5|nr:MFS transporter [Crocosphaera subtropica]ACB53190.1 glucose transport protein [Crocosphaera subtropica ATCC 51142]